MNGFFKEIVMCLKPLIYLLYVEVKVLFNKNMDNRNQGNLN